MKVHLSKNTNCKKKVFFGRIFTKDFNLSVQLIDAQHYIFFFKSAAFSYGDTLQLIRIHNTHTVGSVKRIHPIM